ncbi:phage tail protein [Paenibacillus lautus]|uniref:phage tail protein n=1 Tax=Paenibacillus lautus TaxID=1401 RepID=UPI001C7CFBB9|nr:phage tail protein [Paenibacillus lautus]MBX4147497.1 phage tail protein [Paenibacillus lautus]
MIETEFKNAIQKPKYFLCKPDLKRTTIARLYEVDNDVRKLSRGNNSELSFTLGLYTTDFNTRKKNKHVDMIKEKYLIRFEQGIQKEYYIIDSIKKSMSDNDTVDVNCFGLGYELRDKLIKDYSAVSYTLTQIVHDLLINTIWNVGYVDPQFELKYRSFDFNGTVLGGVNEAAASFQALIVWDTINRTISFYDPEQYGVNKGFKTKFGKLMMNVSQELNTDEFCTRLKLFGKDGMSIQDVNPLGTNFIQNFSYFMYPFQQDQNGIVISHSDYMSDELCKALIRYNQLSEQHQTTYKNLLNQKTTLQEQLSQKLNELSQLKNELDIIEDNLATANATGLPTQALINQKNAKLTQIASKQGEVDSLNSQIKSVDNQITNLGNLLKLENNLTQNEIKELNQFIIEKEASDTNISDPQELLDFGKKEFDKIRQPKIVVQIGLVNFYDILTEQHNVGKLNVGDIVTVEHDELGIHVKAHVSDITFNYKESTIDVTVTNAEELLTDEERFIKQLYKTIGSSNTVDMSKYKWNDAKATVDDVTTIINNTWNAVKRDIIAGVNEDVEISRRGIIIRDPNHPNKILILQHGQLALSSDYGDTWKTAVTSDGVIAERIIGKLLLGNKLLISDDLGTFTIEGNLLTIRDKNQKVRVRLGEYKTNVYGLEMIGDNGKTIIDQDGILSTDTIQEADNVDSTHPLKMKFYIDDDVIRIDKVKLNFSLERFRAYSKGAASQIINLTSTQSETINLNTTESASINLHSTAPQNISGGTETEGTYWGTGGHNHGIAEGTRLATYPVSGAGYVTWVPSGSHSHPISLGSHTHGITVPSHSHSISMPSHSHQISMPSHSHEIVYGIYEGTYATSVQVIIDGVMRDGTMYGSDRTIDITRWITTPGWHTIELTSSQMGRINASIYIKSFVGA